MPGPVVHCAVRKGKGAGVIAACLGLAAACSGFLGPSLTSKPYYRDLETNRGVEPYSAWFGDSDGRILYFGLSPFWTLWWDWGGDPRADLQASGDHLIGRFDLLRAQFLEPLRVRSHAPEARSSVWDVLIHSNGRIYYTTYFEEIGSVLPDGSEPTYFRGLGVGFNELYEGPRGSLFVTRYSDHPLDPERQTFGSVAVLSPDGELLQEFRFPLEGQTFTAPKSLAVDPLSGEIWLNADIFHEDGSASYARLRLSAKGKVLERVTSPELHFVWFDSEGLGWFAEDREGELWLRAVQRGEQLADIPLGPRGNLDFVQDIKPLGRRRVVATLWSGRAFVASLNGTPAAREVRFKRPPDCIPPQGRSLLYTVVGYGHRLFGTLYCGATIVSAELPGNPALWHSRSDTQPGVPLR